MNVNSHLGLELSADVYGDTNSEKKRDIDDVAEDINENESDKKEQINKNTNVQKGKLKSSAVQLLTRKATLFDLSNRHIESHVSKETSKLETKMKQRFNMQYKTHLKNLSKWQLQGQSGDQRSEYQNVIANVSKDALKRRDSEERNESKQEDFQKRKKIQVQKSRLMTQLRQKDTEKLFQTHLYSVAEELVKESPQKKESIRKTRKQLLQQGLSSRKIKTAEQQVQRMIFSDIKKELRRQFVKVATAYDPKKLTKNFLGHYNSFMALTKDSETRGVLDQGKSIWNQEKVMVEGELQSLIADDLDQKLVKTKLKTNDPKVLISVFDELNNLANFVEFDTDSYMRQFHSKLDHLGLNYFVNPEGKGIVDLEYAQGYHSQNDEQSKKQNKKGRSFLLEEGDLGDLEDQLRQLYIKRHTVKGIIARGLLELEIRRCEKKVSQSLPSYNMDALQNESNGLAKLRLTFMLREAFEERATLPELKGPGYTLIKNKLKFSLKKLKALGSPVSRSDRNDIRDQSNRSIFTLIKEDYIRLQVHLESDPKNIFLKQKRDELLKILDRLKVETKINEKIKPKLMQDMTFLSDISITEAA